MNRALFAAASGMAAQQQNLETIAQNLSNAQVAGFKGAAASFTDIASPAGGSIGTMFTGNHTVFTQGRLVHGGGPFDLAIEGGGFFAVLDNKGRRAYTRDGEFSRASDGSLQNAQGLRLEGIRIPENALSATVAEDGTVTATAAKGKIACGRIHLWGFLRRNRFNLSVARSFLRRMHPANRTGSIAVLPASLQYASECSSNRTYRS
jgi:flagellar basal-body rod protein FlgG